MKEKKSCKNKMEGLGNKQKTFRILELTKISCVIALNFLSFLSWTVEFGEVVVKNASACST